MDKHRCLQFWRYLCVVGPINALSGFFLQITNHRLEMPPRPVLNRNMDIATGNAGMSDSCFS